MSSLSSVKSEINISREEALAAVIASIAMEEEALASIMRAESKKLHCAMKNMRPDCLRDMKMLLNLNESVDRVISHILDMQIVLKNKLRLAMGCRSQPPVLPCPPKPRHRKCFAAYSASGPQWFAGKTLDFRLDSSYKHNNFCGLRAEKHPCDSFLIMPAGKDFRAEIDFVMLNPWESSGYVELKHEADGKILLSKDYGFDKNQGRIIIKDDLRLKNDENHESLLSFRLMSSKGLVIKKAVVKIMSMYKSNSSKEEDGEIC